MDLDIRTYIKKNFEDETNEDIIKTIKDSIHSKDEVILPGLGVLFEIIWNNIDNNHQINLANIIKQNI